MFGSKMESLCTSNIGRGHTYIHTVTHTRDKNRKRGDKKYVWECRERVNRVNISHFKMLKIQLHDFKSWSIGSTEYVRNFKSHKYWKFKNAEFFFQYSTQQIIYESWDIPNQLPVAWDVLYRSSSETGSTIFVNLVENSRDLPSKFVKNTGHWDGILGHQFNKRLESFAPWNSRSLLLADFTENNTLLWL